MRLIPRNTKVQTSFYKGLTVLDIVLGVICLALVAVAVSSNLTYKFVIALGIVCVFIPMFLPVGEERIYKCALYMGKHLFSRKSYSERGKDAANIESIVPYECVEGSCILNKDGSYTGVIEIKPMEFRLLGSGKQNYLIDGILTGALSAVGTSQEAAIVKLEKPLDLDGYIQSDLKRIVALADAYENGTLSSDEYRARVDVIDDRLALTDALNSEKSVRYSVYYLTVTDREKIHEARIITPEAALESWGEFMYVFGRDGKWKYYDLCEDEPTLRDVETDLNEQNAFIKDEQAQMQKDEAVM